MKSILLALTCYMDIGLSVHDLGRDSYRQYADPITENVEPGSFIQPTGKPIKNPMGLVETGCSYGNKTFYLKHESSFQEEDYGLNQAGVRLRLFEFGGRK